MENLYNNWDNTEQKKIVSAGKGSPFADSPYISAYTNHDFDTQARETKKQSPTAKRFSRILVVTALTIVACLITALCVSSSWEKKLDSMRTQFENKISAQQEQIKAALEATASGTATDLSEQKPALVYAKNVQAVVAISNQAISTNYFGQVSETASSGSGFIISDDGYVVTNYHVVQGATTLSVITYEGVEHEAALIGFDASNDLAVLKIEETDLPFVELGSSDDLIVGDQVVAIGNPLGELTSTLTVGYISAKDRIVNTDGSYLNMLQTDAAINSGNSGGPLFNMAGQVIGITTAKFSGTSTAGATIEGIGFAIPIDDVAGMIEDLVSHGYVTGAYLGVMVRDVDAHVGQTYGIPSGAFVDDVTKGSCAQKAGIQPKDIIIQLGDEPVGSVAELTRALRRYEAGQTTKITVYRSGKEVELEITFDEKPQTEQTEDAVIEQQPVQTPDEDYGNYFDDWFGGLFPDFWG